MLETELKVMRLPARAPRLERCQAAVIWIDWYAYHVARFAGLCSHPELAGTVAGIELVGGAGVHAGQRFRTELPPELPVATLFPGEDWPLERRPGRGQLRIARALWRKLSRLNPSTVLVPGYYTLPALAAALWARTHRRKSVLMTESTRGDHARSPWKELLKSLLIRGLFGWAVAGGTRHIEYLRALGFPAKRIARFYDVVDNDGLYHRAQELRRSSPASQGLPEKYFLYVGRLAPEKNVAGLLAAYLAHRAAGGAWPLVLVGDGPERASLQAQAEDSLYAADIHFAGHQGAAGLPRYYAFAGCFVLPSTREPWGLVVNEAMACGLPVIVSDRCGCAEDLLAPGGNGFVFAPETPGALRSALAGMEALSETEWLRMSSASLFRIADFTPDRFGEEIAAIVRSGKGSASRGSTRPDVSRTSGRRRPDAAAGKR